MFIDSYYRADDGIIRFTREQGSNFAKGVADDFNPIHDPDSRRFCVPGDLLFSVILARYGLSQHMEVTFTGMVDDGSELVMPEASEELVFNDVEGKEYLTVRRAGDNSRDAELVDKLTRVYVEFSGHTFPHLLVPLMAEQNVMINPSRPMVFYESMVIDLDQLDIDNPALQLDRNELSIAGKRGEAQFSFNLVDGGEVVGRGRKRMVLGGLREYDPAEMDKTVAELNRRRENYSQP